MMLNHLTIGLGFMMGMDGCKKGMETESICVGGGKHKSIYWTRLMVRIAVMGATEISTCKEGAEESRSTTKSV